MELAIPNLEDYTVYILSIFPYTESFSEQNDLRNDIIIHLVLCRRETWGEGERVEKIESVGHSNIIILYLHESMIKDN